MGAKRARVIIPAGVDVWEHELETAQTLAKSGRTVEFLRRIDGNRVNTPDVIMDGVVWEMKAPESRDVRSLQRLLRRAAQQSPNVIVDIFRMKGVSDAAAEGELRRLKPLVKSIRRLIFIGKDRHVVDIG